jgi:hypothetical protein
MIQAPNIYTIQNGILTARNQNIDQSLEQEKTQKIIKYIHTAKISSDQYHTEMIKQYRKENEELRKKYNDLEKAHYELLGYHNQQKAEKNIDKMLDTTPIHLVYKDGTLSNSGERGDTKTKNSSDSSVNVTEFEAELMGASEEDHNITSNPKLTESILEEETAQPVTMGRRCNAKTEGDEDIEELLVQAFR